MFKQFWEHIEIGRHERLGDYTFTQDNIRRFAQHYDPQDFHLSHEAAKKSHFGALCASGWHVAAAFMATYMAHNRQIKHDNTTGTYLPPEPGPSPGVTNLRWKKPVYVGDIITFSATITAKRALNSYPKWGLVEFYAQGTNQNNQDIFSFNGNVFCAKLPTRKRNKTMERNTPITQ